MKPAAENPSAGFPPPALLCEAVPALQRALESCPELTTRGAMAHLRAKLVRTLNAAVAGQRSPARAAEDAMEELGLGISFICWKKGAEGVREYLEPGKFPEMVAIGRKINREYLLDPMKMIRRKNRLSDDEVLSGAVAKVFEEENRSSIQIVSAPFRSSVQRGSFRDFPEALRCDAKKEVQALDRILELATMLGIDKKTIAAAKGNRIESGLCSLIGECEQYLSYLEIGVFTAAFAERHGVKPKTALTFHPKEASRFMKDFDRKWQYKPDVLRQYEDACKKIFHTHFNEAWLILQFYLEYMRDFVSVRKKEQPQLPSEYYFPVHNFSGRSINSLSREMINELQNDRED